jgi:hypothetical protein
LRKRSQEQRQRQQQERAIARAARPLLNKHTYPDLYAKWLADKAAGLGSKLYKCRRCREATIHWDEPAHVCEGFKPMYEDPEVVEARWEARAQERRERREYEIEQIREAKRNGLFFDECSEDEPEEDWFDEDESYEEDDGDPMWD